MSSAAAQFASNWSELLNLDAFVLGVMECCKLHGRIWQIIHGKLERSFAYEHVQYD